MRRDIGNEVVVAIVAVLVLAFALIFGVILSLSSSGSRGAVLAPTAVVEEPTHEMTHESVAAGQSTLEIDAGSTNTAIAQTLQVGTQIVQLLTASAQPEAATLTPENTMLPTEVPTTEATETPANTISPTITERPTQADSTPSAVPTEEATETATQEPATETPNIAQTLEGGTQIVQLLTASAEVFATPDYATTATAAASVVQASELTATRPLAQDFARTATSIAAGLGQTIQPLNTEIPTDTPEPTNTNTPRPTDTPEPTNTNTSRPTNTATSTNTMESPGQATAIALPTAIELPFDLPIPTVIIGAEVLCALPIGWTTYTVQSGDTLFSIALAVNSTVNDLRDANCLANIGTLPPGLPLYVPFPIEGELPEVQAIYPGATPVPGMVQMALDVGAEGCDTAGVVLTSPVIGQVIETVTTIYGTADDPQFSRFEISVRPDAVEDYNLYLYVDVPVRRGALGQINPAFFGGGIHWLRLQVFDGAGSITGSCSIPVIFR